MPFGQALARPAPLSERELENRQYAANYIPVLNTTIPHDAPKPQKQVAQSGGNEESAPKTDMEWRAWAVEQSVAANRHECDVVELAKMILAFAEESAA